MDEALDHLHGLRDSGANAGTQADLVGFEHLGLAAHEVKFSQFASKRLHELKDRHGI